MSQPITKLLLSVAVMGLMACGGGGGGSMTTDPDTDGGTGGGTDGSGTDGGDGGDGITQPPSVVTGTNGLDFGEAGQSLTDAEAVEITTRSAAFEVGSGATTGDAEITLGAGFLAAAPADRTGTVQIGNETVSIANGAGALSSGEAVIVTFEPDRAGTYAGAVEVSIAGATGSAINGENAFVFGFETDPDVIADRTSGLFEYVGGFQAFGSLDDADDTSTEYEGEMTVVVDFAGSGSADVTLDGQLDGTTDADLGGTLAISENGFSGALSCTSGCTGTGSSVNAGFFGPDADEVAGVLGADFTAGGATFDGVGSFILTDPTAR